MAVVVAAAPISDSLGMNATAELSLQVTLNENTRTLYVTFVDANGRIAESGTDGGAITADFTPVLANQDYAYVVAKHPARVLGGKVIFLASDVNSSLVKVRASEF
jgi:hypothetical protein